MKPNGFLRAGFAIIVAFLAGIPGARAQVPGGVNAAFTRLFENHKAFTAHADGQVLDSAGKETVVMPMSFAELDGNIRVEMDLDQIKSKDLSAKQIAAMKQAGISRIVSIIRPDKKESYILYPGIQNYTIVPMPKTETDAVGKDMKIEKTPLGKETVDGHPCVKNRVVFKNGTNVVLDATTWNASDLKDFPVKIQMKDGDSTSILRFRQIQFAKPDPKQFEPTVGYKLTG